ncbi:hypothetical protein M885DRAFT_540191, partial [Pelagophyceae sp. CCMP2097]
LQERALKALLGKAIGPGARINYDLLLSVFRVWRLDDRRELDRALYYYHSVRARRRPWRKAVMEKFEETAQEQTARGAEFRRTSPTAAILLAVKALSRLQRQRQSPTNSSEENEAEDQSSNSSDESGAWSMSQSDEDEQPSGESSEASSYDSDDAGADTLSDDDDPLGLRSQARRLGAKAKGLLGREAARLRKGRLCRVDSAALFNALNPSAKWLRKLAGSCRADEAGLSVPAMLVGTFWPCAQIRCSGRPRRCPCGYTGQNLMLHFIFGDAGDGIACILARWLGGGCQWMPRKLAEGLPHDFIATFGEYARRARADGVLDEMVKAATASANQQAGAAPACAGTDTEGEPNDSDGGNEDPEEESDDDDDDHDHAEPSHDDDGPA